ncbi:MAG: TRAP transporter TatT component family protein [Syntrophorhabdaceae bacterium]|nr:TRAP transporter TatT component family protein [Syntrophorhabdaceae bacterium]
MKARLILVFLVAVAAVACACSPRNYITSKAADALSSDGGAFARDDDPELVREATPFALKTMESLLAQQPRHKGLLLSLSRGFTQYSAAFVLQDALEEENLLARAEKINRARRLLLRAKEYGLRGLSVSHEDFDSRLSADPVRAAALAGLSEVPLLYWTAAPWSLAVSLSSNDPAMLADLPRCEALMRRALALDESYDSGAIHEYFIAFEGGRPAAMGGSLEKARRHFERAMELSGERKVSPLVSYAETISVRTQNKKEFLELLDRALRFNARESAPEFRMANLVAQRRARWLKGRADDLFLE